ncbi:MAG: nuclear transport factor 2 family protein [Gemmatimonadetes bacterium]|nr:nuclear transport factor 2 family protein [Gemmatimonadota bacterium]
MLACTAEQKPPPPAQADAAAVRQEIEKANARFLAALQSGDRANISANYASDATIMMPNEEAWRGHDALTKGLRGFMFAYMVTEGGTKTEDVMVSGDLAVETRTFQWTLTSKKGKAIQDQGKHVTVWKGARPPTA